MLVNMMQGTQMMYLGSLMIALAVEESGTESQPSALSCEGLHSLFNRSMWISNAATAAMMVPILEAVLSELGLSRAEKSMMMLR